MSTAGRDDAVSGQRLPDAAAARIAAAGRLRCALGTVLAGVGADDEALTS